MKNKIKGLIFVAILAFFPISSKAFFQNVVDYAGEAFSSVTSALPDIDLDIDLPDISGVTDSLPSLTSEDTKVTPIKIWKTLEFDIFFDTFEVTGWGTCPDYPIDSFGIDLRIIEPKGFIETTSYKWNFPFIGEEFADSGDILKNGDTRTNKDEEGNDGGRGEIVYSHYIKFPIFGVILSNNMFCFDNIATPFFYFAEIDPTFLEDYMAVYMHPIQKIEQFLFMNTIGLLTTIIDCIASEVVNMSEIGGTSSIPEYGDMIGGALDSVSGVMTAFAGGARKMMDYPRDMMVYSAGCNGFSTVGGYSEGKDPYADHDMVNLSTMDTIVTWKNIGIGMTSQFAKRTEMYAVPMPSMCWPLPQVHVLKSQYIFQMAGWPEIGKGHVPGTTAVRGSGTNAIGANDETVSFLWNFRDYRAFAYKCI